MKYFIILIAVLLCVASFFVIYPDPLIDVYGEQTISDALAPVTDGEDIFDSISFDRFPLCDRIEEICSAYVPFINGNITAKPEINTLLAEAFAGDELLDTIYSFLIVALLSIPVYMLFRLFPFNMVYDYARSSPFLAKPFSMGLTACACSIVSLTVTWFLYHTLLYKQIVAAIIDWAGSLSQPEIALNVTNILIIVVGVVVVIGLLKTTLFRGSFITSILMAVLRTLLFTVIIAMGKTFIGCDTLNVVLIGIALVFIVGVADMIIEPATRKR